MPSRLFSEVCLNSLLQWNIDLDPFIQLDENQSPLPAVEEQKRARLVWAIRLAGSFRKGANFLLAFTVCVFKTCTHILKY